MQEIRKFSSHTGWVYKPARLFELITISQGLQAVSKVTKPHW